MNDVNGRNKHDTQQSDVTDHQAQHDRVQPQEHKPSAAASDAPVDQPQQSPPAPEQRTEEKNDQSNISEQNDQNNEKHQPDTPDGDNNHSDKETQLLDAIVRLQADMDNIRKRHANEIAAAHSFGLEKLMRELLPVLDSFDMGLHSTMQNEENKALLEGMQLTSKMLMDALEKHKLSVIAPQGDRFNPEHHEAMTIIPRPDLEDNTIVEVIQKGYSLAGRLLRPARVIVSGKKGHTG